MLYPIASAPRRHAPTCSLLLVHVLYRGHTACITCIHRACINTCLYNLVIFSDLALRKQILHPLSHSFLSSLTQCRWVAHRQRSKCATVQLAPTSRKCSWAYITPYSEHVVLILDIVISYSDHRTTLCHWYSLVAILASLSFQWMQPWQEQHYKAAFINNNVVIIGACSVAPLGSGGKREQAAPGPFRWVYQWSGTMIDLAVQGLSSLCIPKGKRKGKFFVFGVFFSALQSLQECYFLKERWYLMFQVTWSVVAP